MERIFLEEYVRTLKPEVQRVYRQCDSLLVSLNDTLDDDFQIAAEIVRVFENYAQQRDDRIAK
jgi:hypothetical protein